MYCTDSITLDLLNHFQYIYISVSYRKQLGNRGIETNMMSHRKSRLLAARSHKPESSYTQLFRSEDFFFAEPILTINNNPANRMFQTEESSYWLDDLLEELTKVDHQIASNVEFEFDQLKCRNIDIEEDRKPRIRWKRDELIRLWSGIALYGNEWVEVQNYVGCKTYSQVKDKGRRLLQNENWITGKKKNDIDEGKFMAKCIAKKKLKVNLSFKRRKTDKILN